MLLALNSLLYSESSKTAGTIFISYLTYTKQMEKFVALLAVLGVHEENLPALDNRSAGLAHRAQTARQQQQQLRRHR